MNACERPDRPDFKPDVEYERSWREWSPGEYLGHAGHLLQIRCGCGHIVDVPGHRVRFIANGESS